jgi:NAD+ diphosphatase
VAADPFTASLIPGDLGFTGALLDRADHVRSNSEALDALRTGPSARFVLFSELKPVLDLSSGIPALVWFSGAEVPENSSWVFLGLRNGEPYFAVAVSCAAFPRGEPMDLRTAAAQTSHADAALLGQGRALLAWHERHTHCSVCGSSTHSTKGGYQRICETCKAEHFPRTDPVVIMLVIDGDRCLLGRQPRFPAGFYSSLAGFIEPGESMEEAVAREVFEEAGVRIGRVRYVASQPWPFPSSLMIGCFAEAISTDIHIDATELEDAKWFTKAEVCAALAGNGPFRPSPHFAIARNLLQAWAALE